MIKIHMNTYGASGGWKCTQRTAGNRTMCCAKAIVGISSFPIPEGINFKGDGVCINHFPVFIKDKEMLINDGIFIPACFTGSSRISIQNLLLLIYPNHEVVFI